MSRAVVRQLVIVIVIAAVAAPVVRALLAPSPTTVSKPRRIELLNASYDPTRELWQAINRRFVSKYEAQSGVELKINQSHASSGTQARAIIDGLEADVATLSIWSDVDALRKKKLIREDWEARFPNRSLPYTSTVVFVVRKGNPKHIHDWPDLVKSKAAVITPNPKTSGNGRLTFLAAWGDAILKGQSEAQARQFMADLYHQVPVLDTGARGATITFSKKGIGDVHVAVESEACMEVRESNGALELVCPPRSIIHEPHIAIVDHVVDERGTREVAEAYLNYLYTPEAQQIIAEHDYRPIDPAIQARHAKRFPQIELYPLTKLVPDWDAAHKKFFADGALFDAIYDTNHSANPTGTPEGTRQGSPKP